MCAPINFYNTLIEMASLKGTPTTSHIHIKAPTIVAAIQDCLYDAYRLYVIEPPKDNVYMAASPCIIKMTDGIGSIIPSIVITTDTKNTVFTIQGSYTLTVHTDETCNDIPEGVTYIELDNAQAMIYTLRLVETLEHILDRYDSAIYKRYISSLTGISETWRPLSLHPAEKMLTRYAFRHTSACPEACFSMSVDDETWESLLADTDISLLTNDNGGECESYHKTPTASVRRYEDYIELDVQPLDGTNPDNSVYTLDSLHGALSFLANVFDSGDDDIMASVWMTSYTWKPLAFLISINDSLDFNKDNYDYLKKTFQI